MAGTVRALVIGSGGGGAGTASADGNRTGNAGHSANEVADTFLAADFPIRIDIGAGGVGGAAGRTNTGIAAGGRRTLITKAGGRGTLTCAGAAGLTQATHYEPPGAPGALGGHGGTATSGNSRNGGSGASGYVRVMYFGTAPA